MGLACGASWALNGRLVMLLLGRCGEAYEVGTQPIRAAAQAAGSQTVNAFCTFLGWFSSTLFSNHISSYIIIFLYKISTS